MRGSLFFASCRNVTPSTRFAERCTPVVAPPPGNLCIPHRVLTNSAFYPPPPFVLQALLRKKKAMGVVDTKKEATF